MQARNHRTFCHRNLRELRPYLTIASSPSSCDVQHKSLLRRVEIRMSADLKDLPDAQRIDKAAVLTGFYAYLGARIDSVGRRAAFMMALLGSFLGIASAAMIKGQSASIEEKLVFLFTHPSILVGLAAIIVLLLSEIARLQSSDDLLSRIGFSHDPVDDLHRIYAHATINDLFGEMIKNARIVGGFLKLKVRLYNAGSVLFVVAVVLFVCGW
jgi:hypothetical protein